MDSVQCYQPTEKSCHEVTEVASLAVESHGSQNGYSEKECYSQTKTQYTDHGTDKTQIQFYHSQTQADEQKYGHGHHQASNAKVVCHGTTKKRGEHKKGLFHRIKDKISGDSGGSSSDSESDDEKCGRGKSG